MLNTLGLVAAAVLTGHASPDAAAPGGTPTVDPVEAAFSQLDHESYRDDVVETVMARLGCRIDDRETLGVSAATFGDDEVYVTPERLWGAKVTGQCANRLGLTLAVGRAGAYQVRDEQVPTGVYFARTLTALDPSSGHPMHRYVREVEGEAPQVMVVWSPAQNVQYMLSVRPDDAALVHQGGDDAALLSAHEAFLDDVVAMVDDLRPKSGRAGG